MSEMLKRHRWVLLEQKVWTALKKGKERAPVILLRVYYSPLCNYAYSLLKDWDKAEEVVQSTIKKVWYRRQFIEYQTSAKSYIYKAVHDSCLKEEKHKKRSKRRRVHDGPAISAMMLPCLILPFRNLNGQTFGVLTIEVFNSRVTNGKATVNLFRSQREIPKKPFLQLTASVVDGKAILKSPHMPFGEYAAMAFHDGNTNEILDHKFGFPSEAMGFSNDWKLTLFSGMPTFEKLKFAFSDKNASICIKIGTDD